MTVVENIVGEQPQDELPAEGLDVLECNGVRLHASLLHHGSDLDDEQALKTSQYGPHDDVVASGLLALSLGRSHTNGIQVEMDTNLSLLA